MKRQFFSFYGGKHAMAKRLGPPRHKHIIEPFAGSAGYSTYWWQNETGHRVTLVERDPLIAGLWRYLLRVTPRELQRLPECVENVDDLHDVPQEAKWLIGFWMNKGLVTPAKRPSRWARDETRDSNHFKFGPRKQWSGQFWSRKVRDGIAAQLSAIQGRWKIIEGDWSDAPDVEAHWHIDPPYAEQGKHYKYNDVDFAALSEWCKRRRGYVQVCENHGAKWLEFEQFHLLTTAKGGHRKGWSKEAVFQQGRWGFEFPSAKGGKANGDSAQDRARTVRHARTAAGRQGPAEVAKEHLRHRGRTGRR